MNPSPLTVAPAPAPVGLARTLLDTARRQVERWAELSQQRACVNARAAVRSLAEVRAQHDDVEAYLAEHARQRGTAPRHEVV